MVRFLLPLVWSLMAVAVITATHYYLWARLVRDTAPSPPWRLVGFVAIITLALLMPLAFLLSRLLPGFMSAPFVWAGFLWMGMMFYLLLVVFLGDIVRLVSHGVHLLTTTSTDPDRRVFLARLVGGTAAAATAVAGAAAFRTALAGPAIKKVKVALARLPAELSGITIVQLSDLHVGPTLSRGFVEDLVRRTNDLAPDVVAITGDLVDGSVAELAHAVAPLGELKCRYGVFFVTGNHEYYSGVSAWLVELEKLGIRVLRNERVAIGNGQASFDLAGVDDASAAMFGDGHGMDVDKACAGCDPEREVVLLAHQPKAIFEAAKMGVGLVLAGHTHGGQIWPFTYLVALTQPYLSGLHRHSATTQIYVSRGTGYWGPPMRLGAPAEVTHLSLVRA